MKDARILVVDDEPQILRFLKPALDAAGYQVIEAETGSDALRKAATHAPDLIILDLGLPDMDGKEVITRVRAFSPVPILILSARDREHEKIAALDCGADDYIEKPFHIGELAARIRAALRHARPAETASTRLEVDGLLIDFEHRRVSRGDQIIKLTPKEYDLLAILSHHAGKVVTHKTLLQSVWGAAHGEDTQYLRVFIGQLRAKIERDPAKPRIIGTEPGVGYRLDGRTD